MGEEREIAGQRLKRALELLKGHAKPVGKYIEGEIGREADEGARRLFEERFGVAFGVADKDLEPIRAPLTEHVIKTEATTDLDRDLVRQLWEGLSIGGLASLSHLGFYHEEWSRALVARGLYGLNARAIPFFDHPENKRALADLYRLGFVFRLKPGAPLEELAWLLTGPGLDGGESATLTLATHQFMPHMIEHVTNKALMTQKDLRIRQGRRILQLRAKSYADVNTSLTDPPDEVLKRMHRSLLQIKQYGAALLKTQLDLMSEAYKAGGQLPAFHYNFAEALERQGYKRQSHGAFDPPTMDGLRRRVVALAYQSIEVLELSSRKNNSKYIEATPYWVIETTRRLTAGDEFNYNTVLFDSPPDAPVFTGFTMRPGLWWPMINMGQFRLEIPSAVLELPTDGNGNEVERLALQLTPTLAIWERSSQGQHAGRDVSYSVGKLLEAANYTTRDAFLSAHSETAKRTREYLASTSGTSGAIPLLNSLGAFGLDIRDEADFYASGRGWRERFWNAHIRLSVRNLGLPKKAKR